MAANNIMKVLLERVQQKSIRGQWLCIAAMFLLGLNLPKSFTFLTFFLVAALWASRRAVQLALLDPLIRVLIFCLVLFGISFSVRQWQLGYWQSNAQSISDLLSYTILPSACLVLGFSARQRWMGRSWVSAAVFAFAVGGLIYVLTALGISRHPWWNFAEIFPDGITVPWSPHGQFSQNVRSVEQRAFPAATLLCCVPLLVYQKQCFWRLKSLSFFVIGALGFYSLLSLDGRLFYISLALSFAPYLFMINRKPWRLTTITIAAALIALGMHLRVICDERLMMQSEFLKQIFIHPWGGRRISFSFQGCPGQGVFQFGPPPSFMHLPHNIFLDTINDVGVVPAFFLFVAALMILLAIGNSFMQAASLGAWNADQLLRFGLVSAIICQAMLQPFIYSDQSMFVVTFLLTGVIIAESRLPG